MFLLTKLNGWQRLGIVAAVFWALISSVWCWSEPHNDTTKSFFTQLEICKLWDKPETPYEKCKQVATEVYEDNWNTETKKFWLFTPFVISIPVLIVWLLISLCIITVRWIRKGFQ